LATLRSASGAVAGFGGTTRLPRLVGRGRAAELLLTGRLLTAEEAMHCGLNLLLEGSAALGADYFGLAASTDEFKTGTKAFLEKRPTTCSADANELGAVPQGREKA